MILQDFLQYFAQDLKVFLDRILESSCQELIKNLLRTYQDLA